MVNFWSCLTFMNMCFAAWLSNFERHTLYIKGMFSRLFKGWLRFLLRNYINLRYICVLLIAWTTSLIPQADYDCVLCLMLRSSVKPQGGISNANSHPFTQAQFWSECAAVCYVHGIPCLSQMLWIHFSATLSVQENIRVPLRCGVQVPKFLWARQCCGYLFTMAVLNIKHLQRTQLSWSDNWDDAEATINCFCF